MQRANKNDNYQLLLIARSALFNNLNTKNTPPKL